MEQLLWLTVLVLSVTSPDAQSPAGTVSTSGQDLDSCHADQGACVSQDSNVAVFPAEGGSSGKELYIGGIFPVHEPGAEPFSCGRINVDSFQEMMAFYWAVSTSMERWQTAVPQVSKGAVIFDTCGTDYVATQSIFGVEKCKSMPSRPDVPFAAPSGNATSQRSSVDRRAILGYINGVDSRNGQMESEASQIMVGLNKPVINTGTYSEHFTARKPGARNNHVTPTIKHQIEATADVIRSSVYSDEVFVLVVYSDDAFSLDAFNEFKMMTNARNICIIYESKLHIPLQEADLQSTARGLLVNKHARFVLNLLSEDHFRILYRRILDRTNNLDNFTFVFPPFAEGASTVVTESGLGALQLRHQDGTWLNRFKNFYSKLNPEMFPSVPFVAEFWQQRFQCNLIGFNGNNGLLYRDFCNNSRLTLDNDDISKRISYVITATDALLMSIEKVRKESCSGNDVCFGLPQQKFDDAIKKTVIGGEMLFDQNTGGPASWEFEVYNFQREGEVNQYMPVGWVFNRQSEKQAFGPGNITSYERLLANGVEGWARTTTESRCPLPACRGCRAPPPPVTTTSLPTVPPRNDDMERIMDSDGGRLTMHRVSHDAIITGIHFQQFRSNYTTRLYASNYRSIWSVALAALAGLGIIAVILLEISLIYLILTYKFEEPEGRHRSHLNFRSLWLGQLLLFGIFLSYLTLFAYLPVPTKATCGITRFGIGMSYALIFSCLLVKLMVIRHSRTAIPGEVNPSSQHSITYMVSLFLIAFCVQLIIEIHWLIQIPPQAVLVRDNSGSLEWICNHYTWSLQHNFWDMPFFVRTEFENHLLSLIYIMFLIFVTFYLSLRAFYIVSNMRESRFIALASGITILIFIAWAMIGGFLKGHQKAHEIGDGCIGFGLFFTATVILFALFMPKVRQLVVIGMEGVFLEDDKETTYASSIYSPGTHKSFSGYADGSVIGMHPMDRSVHVMGETSGINFPADDSRPIINVDTSFISNDPPYMSNPNALRLVHPRSSGPSLYSVRSTPNLYDPSDMYSTRGAKVTRNLTGRSYMNETFSGSEYPSLYRPRSEVQLYKHPRSEIGSL